MKNIFHININLILLLFIYFCIVSEEEYEDYSLDLNNLDYFESSSTVIPVPKKSNRKGLRNFNFNRKEKYDIDHVVRPDKNKDSITCKPGFKAEKNECEGNTT